MSQTGEGRQRSPATGFKKPRKQSLSGGLVIYYFFFYFSVALVVRGEKSPQLRAFSRQPARQRDSNGVGNRLSFPRIFQKGSSTCSVTSTNPSGVFSRPLSAPVAGASRSQPFCLPYPSNIRGLEKYFHPVIPWFIMSLTSRISHCFGSSKGWFKASLKSCLEHTALPV